MKLDLLDSSAWIECLFSGPNAVHFEPILLKLPNLLVPTIVITEVRKVVIAHRSLVQADEVTRAMASGIVVEIDVAIATQAANLFHQHKLPLADSLIYAVAQSRGAVVWTQDDDFQGLPDVQYFAKVKTPKPKP